MKKHKNQIVIFTLLLISLDAYNIMNIPIQYFGFAILFFLIPIEELTGFTGLIFGICYKMLKKDLFHDPIV